MPSFDSVAVERQETSMREWGDMQHSGYKSDLNKAALFVREAPALPTELLGCPETNARDGLSNVRKRKKVGYF